MPPGGVPFVQVAEMTTHAAKGLTENDFIMAAKVRGWLVGLSVLTERLS